MPYLLPILFLLAMSVQAEELKDPTRPDYLVSEVGTSKQFEVTSILVSAERRIAVVNNQIVKVGDTVDGNKIISIEANEVQLQGPDGIITVNLVDKSILQPVN